MLVGPDWRFPRVFSMDLPHAELYFTNVLAGKVKTHNLHVNSEETDLPVHSTQSLHLDVCSYMMEYIELICVYSYADSMIVQQTIYYTVCIISEETH